MKLLMFFVLCLLMSCVTPEEKDRMNADIFELKTKLFTMENRVKGQNSQTTVQGKTLATSHSRLDKMEFALQKIQGDVDALRVGVVTGQMPGANPDQEGSIAKSIAELQERLEKLEANQHAVMGTMDQMAKSKKTASKATAKAPTPKASLSHLQRAYKAKQYKYVALEAPKFLVKANSKDKGPVMFMYAESLYKLGRLRDAALKYNDYIDLGSKEHLAHAKMRMGDCFRHLGEKSTAKLYYEELVALFPSTAEAEKAKERLQKM